MRPTIHSLLEPHYKQNHYANPKRTAKSRYALSIRYKSLPTCSKRILGISPQIAFGRLNAPGYSSSLIGLLATRKAADASAFTQTTGHQVIESRGLVHVQPPLTHWQISTTDQGLGGVTSGDGTGGLGPSSDSDSGGGVGISFGVIRRAPPATAIFPSPSGCSRGLVPR